VSSFSKAQSHDSISININKKATRADSALNSNGIKDNGSIKISDSKPGGVSIKKFALGIGVSNYNILGNSYDKLGGSYNPSALKSGGIGNNYGGNIKFDLLVGSKFCFGVSMIATTMKMTDYTFYNVNTFQPECLVNYNMGHVFNASFNSTFYILGKNTNKSKACFYIILGVGYNDWLTKETVTSANGNKDSVSYYKYNSDWSIRSFSGIVGLGTSFKLGPGKFFLELPSSFDIYGEDKYKIYNVTDNRAEKLTSKEEKTDGVFKDFHAYVFLNFGYTFYF
jgi:hypothetical protein